MSTWVKSSTLASPDGTVAVTPRQGGGYALSTLGPGVSSSALQPIWWLKGDYGLTAGSTWLNAGTAGGSATCPATSTAATVNGLPALSIPSNAVGNTVTVPNVSFTGIQRSVFIVIKPNANLSTGNITCTLLGIANTTPAAAWPFSVAVNLSGATSGSANMSFGSPTALSGASGIANSGMLTSVHYPYANIASVTTPILVGGVYNVSVANSYSFLNSVPTATSTSTFNVPSSWFSTPITYNWPATSTVLGYTAVAACSLCELQIYDGIMSQSQAASIVAGLVAKWGVVG